MAIFKLPVDQRVIDIDSRRFASVEKAIVELITNSDDSYSRMEQREIPVTGNMTIRYERHQSGAVLIVADQAEGMSFDQLHSILSYGGAYSQMARGEAGGRGYFGRGLKQAIFGLGHGWIETIFKGRFGRVDLFTDENGAYLFDDGDQDRAAQEKDYARLGIPPEGNGTQVTIIIENPQTNIPYFNSLVFSISNNIYLRDILRRRQVSIINLNQAKSKQTALPLAYAEPEAELLIGPEAPGLFRYQEVQYSFDLTLKKALDADLVLKGDERTNGLLVISGTAVFDCQFFRFENQLGTEYLFGTVHCPGLAKMLVNGKPIISDEREGLNMKEPFTAAFGEAVSDMIAGHIKNEQIRLSHVDYAKTSLRTRNMIRQVLQRMNQIAIEDLGIILPPGPGSGRYGQFDTGRPSVLRFTTPFYYRKVGHPFHVKMIADRNQIQDQELLSITYQLPDSIRIEPNFTGVMVADLPEDGHLEWMVIGNMIGAKGIIEVATGDYRASAEIVIAENASGKGYGNVSSKPSIPWNMDNSIDIFAGYELRNLDNDLDRAVYLPEERLIVINTEAPTVRLYVNGQGHFKDGARLLLAELLLDVITDELSRRYVDRTTQKGQAEAYKQAKHDLIRRYGLEIHSILLGE
ncbi:MAG TPA: ATP-binding protein [Peptococcaceae bacterium]|nr:ATP-binding protein [Peptococcaceae bacterium]